MVPKAELLQLNQTQFPSLGIFVSKKVKNRKNYDHFYYISFKSCILCGLSFFETGKFPGKEIEWEMKYLLAVNQL